MVVWECVSEQRESTKQERNVGNNETGVPQTEDKWENKLSCNKAGGKQIEGTNMSLNGKQDKIIDLKEQNLNENGKLKKEKVYERRNAIKTLKINSVLHELEYKFLTPTRLNLFMDR